MKLKSAGLILAGAMVIGMGNAVAQAQSKGLVVHEWGTFTSFQGSDGVLLPWKPLETSKLPGFVHNWKSPGLGLVNWNMELIEGKGSIMSLQRMETPVVYVYSDKETVMDVSVAFPKGTITEWYPRASHLGPAAIMGVVDGKLATSQTAPVATSMIGWSNVQISPLKSQAAPALPFDKSGSHYYAARETDSAMLRMEPSSTGKQPEHEKFLFYRGIGNFTTPLTVTMKSDDTVTISNAGTEPLGQLFVLKVSGKAGWMGSVGQLSASEKKEIKIGTTDASVFARISREMAAALVKEGLYPREAEAMVNTWRDSWFEEDGLRVLYVLPPSWTDKTLPMKLNPKPDSLVRVMVGRAEILPAGIERNFAQQLGKAGRGDTLAFQETQRTMKSFGRFAEPALNRAHRNAGLTVEQWSKIRPLLLPPPATPVYP